MTHIGPLLKHPLSERLTPCAATGRNPWSLLALGTAAVGLYLLRPRDRTPPPLLPFGQVAYKSPQAPTAAPAPLAALLAAAEPTPARAVASAATVPAVPTSLATRQRAPASDLNGHLGTAKRVLVTLDTPSSARALRLTLEKGTPGRFVCLHGADDVKALLTQLRQGPQGSVAIADGPLREVFTQGGTLFIDYNGFTQPEAESLNELFARVPTYGGVAVHPDLRIVGAVPLSSIAASHWSPAFLNRFHRLVNAPARIGAQDPADAIDTISAEALPSAHVIDLHSGRTWQQLLAPHVQLNAQGALEWVKAPLDTLLTRGASVVLRNPPLDDAHFVDFMRGMVRQHGASRLAYFHGYTEAEQQARMQRHTWVVPCPPSGAYTVTARGFAALFEQTVVCPDGRVASAPGVLEALRPEQVLLIATPLAASQWNAILGHPTPLKLSLAPTVPVPDGLAASIPAALPLPQATAVDLRTWTPAPGSATVLHTYDADAATHALRTHLPNAIQIDVSDDLQADELLRALHKTSGRYHFATRPMAQHLERGGVVLLRGLERQPNLQQDLAARLLDPAPQGAIVILQSGRDDGLLEEVAHQGFDGSDAMEHAERIAQALARPGLDATTVANLLTFARETPEATAHTPRTWGLAFMRKLAAYHVAHDGKASPQSWGHSLADLLRHERGADAWHARDLTARAHIAFGPAPQDAANDIDARQARCMRMLQEHRAVFLQGPPGAGKSYQAQAMARALDVTPERLHTLSVGPATTRADLLGRNVVRGDSIVFEDGPLATWARDTRPGIKLLVVDEANLPRSGFWRFLRGAFDAQPTLLIDGTPVALSDEHKIIFTGNDDHVVGRFVHTELRDCFIPQHFVAYTPDFLREHIALPTLQRLAPQLAPQQATQVAQQALDVHQAVAHLPHGMGLSPRNLEEAVVRAAYALSQNDTSLEHAIGDAYAGLFSADTRAGLEAWQLLTRGAAPRPAAAQLGRNAQGIVWTHSTCELARTVDDFLNVRNWRLAHGHSAVGQVGLLVQGPSGRGKDEVVAQRLSALHIDHTVLNAGMDYASLSQAIQTARSQGTVVVLSEMNLLPAGVLEGRLNDVLSGPGTHPGFALIATINPPAFSGRAPLSDALTNRFVVHNLGEYDAQEVHQLVRDRLHMLRSPVDIANLAETHNALVQDMQRVRSPYVPSARELVRGAERLAEDPTLAAAEVTDELYALQKSVLPPQLSQEETIRAAPALTTLANLLQPQQGWCVAETDYVGLRGCRAGALITVDAAAPTPVQQAQVLWQLLLTEPAFAMPRGADRLLVLSGQLEMAAQRYPALAAEFEYMRAQLPATQGSWLARTQGDMGGRTGDTDEAPVNVSRKGLSKIAWPKFGFGFGFGSDSGFGSGSGSGSGSGPLHLEAPHAARSGLESSGPARVIVGDWTPATSAQRAYLTVQTSDTFLPDGSMVSTVSVPGAAPLPAERVSMGAMSLVPYRSALYHGTKVAQLLVPAGQQPTGISIFDYGTREKVQRPMEPVRTPNGVWIVELPPEIDGDAIEVEYTLVAAAPESAAPWQAASEQPLPFRINYAAWPELVAAMDDLDLTHPEMALRALQHFFNTHVRYSRSPEVRSKYAAIHHLPLVNRLLTLKTGCCFETAHAFAAIARDLFGGAVPVRKVGGHVASAEGISEGHAWVEVFLPERGWTVFDPTGGSIDEATLEALEPRDFWPSHVLTPVTQDQLRPLQASAPLARGARTIKRSAVAAEIAPAFRRALADKAEAFLFNAVLDVRDSFALIPGRLDVERLVRGEVEPFMAQAVGRARDAKTVLLSANHPALSPGGSSAAHETLRAMLDLDIPIQVFRSNGELVPVRSMAEALALQEPLPYNIALRRRQDATLALYATQLAERPGTYISQSTDDELFVTGRAAWLDLAQHAASLPSPSDRANSMLISPGHLEIGCEYTGMRDEHAEYQQALQAHAYVEELDVNERSPVNFETLELPAMPNLRDLHFRGEARHVKMVVPHQVGPLHVHGLVGGSSPGIWLTIYAAEPHRVEVDDGLRECTRVLPASAWPGAKLPEGEYLVDEPIDFLRNKKRRL